MAAQPDPDTSAAASIPAATGHRRVWLRVGTLLDGSGNPPLRDGQVVYDQDLILYAGADTPPRDCLGPAQRTPDAQLPDYTLLPGLIEAHAHLFLEGGELDPEKRSAHLRQSPDMLLQLASARLDKLVRPGIIAVRDAGDRHGVGLALSRLDQDMRQSRLRPRGQHPYIDSPGAAIHRRGRYGSFMGEPLEDCPSPRGCVEARVSAGADRIKIIATGIIDFQAGAVAGQPQFTAEEVGEFTAAARSLGKQTLAHTSGAAGIDNVIAGRVDSVEHGFFVTADQLARMRDRQITWVPTFAPVQKQLDHAGILGWDAKATTNLRCILDQHAASLMRARALGVPILAGSDAGSWGVLHGFGLLDELELMERAGLSPLEVLHAVTGAPSQRLALRDNLGQIRPGFLSRFLLTRHSPLATVANLRRPKIVVFDGAVLSAEDIDPIGL
ncbi:MAG TPA: amidohydrolase family protein [Acidobacteriaceae bacterium]|nr:amidohydrolase family protein [Acidobacteriaceae bacterium]